MLCQECFFWIRQEKDQENQGDCHRFPPTPFLRQQVSRVLPGVPSMDITIITLFPKTQAHLGCGEFMPKDSVKS